MWKPCWLWFGVHDAAISASVDAAATVPLPNFGVPDALYAVPVV